MAIRTREEKDITFICLEGRIDSNNAAQIEEEIASITGSPDGKKYELDAQDLEYISSAGLRVLMKLIQSQDEPLVINNVNPNVYEIFEVTGFDELMTVKKALRQLSVDGLEPIGKGATATVYRLDRETVLKVFNPEASISLIKQENERSRNAFVSGIPTAIAYDMVKVGDCYGTVFELLDAKDFLTELVKDREHLAENIKHFAVSIRKMHQIEVDPARFTPVKAGSLYAVNKLAGVCTPEEIDKLRKLYESIPDRFTFIHGDCHPGNAMVQNGEFVFIDLMTCGCGHPIFDMSSMCSIYHNPHIPESPLLEPFSKEEIGLIWDVYLRSYLDTDDEEFIRKVERQVSAVSAARNLFAAVFIPGLIPQHILDELKSIALSYVDEGIEPITF